MSNLGPVYEDDEHYSPGRQNAKSILRDTGANIVAIAPTKQLGLVCPTDTSGGLVKNVTYYVDYNSSFSRIGFEPIFHRHLHNQDTHEAGGTYFDMRIANITNFVEVNFVTHMADPIDFWKVEASGGVITHDYGASGGDESYHMIDTLSTTNNYITATLGGVQIEFGSEFQLVMGMDLTRNSNILVRNGINIDRISDTPSTSRRQLALEGCDGHGTNWVMLNANGNSASLIITATTMPLDDVSGFHTYQLKHIPATEDRVFYDAVSNAVSSTNIADDGFSERARLFRWGVKLPAGTANIQQRMAFMNILGDQRFFI